MLLFSQKKPVSTFSWVFLYFGFMCFVLFFLCRLKTEVLREEVLSHVFSRLLVHKVLGLGKILVTCISLFYHNTGKSDF